MHERSSAQATITFERYQLSNGLDVVLHEDHKAPLVHILVWYHVGSKNESADRTGFAHLFEHMMFQGSDNVGKSEHFTWVQGVGGTLNATTGQDRTNYFETLPSEYLGLGLWLEADRMRSLKVTDENLNNQRSVVREERSQRYDNAPYGLWYLTLLEMLFQGSSYAWGPIGDMAQLEEAPLDEVQRFHRRWYVPNNATLVLAGDFDPAEAIPLVEDLFGSIAPGEALPITPITLPPITQQRRRSITARVPIPSVYIGFQSVALDNPDARALDLAAMVLNRGRSSRLQRELVYRSQIAQNVAAFNIDMEYGGLFVMLGTTSEGTTPEELEEGLWREVDKMSREKIEQRELDAALNRIRTSLVMSMGRLQGVADALAHSTVYRDDPSLVNSLLEEYHAVTPDDIQRAVATWLRPSSAAVLYYLPEEEGLSNGK